MDATLNCERCNAVIVKIDATKVKDWLQANDGVCKKCKTAEAGLVKFYESKRERFLGQMDKILADAKTELVAETKRLAAEPTE